ncbi:hypothetical protein AVEN_51642-1 [Araneus ventricosus]|uniref:Uncharacterized protein n=1 Tax=Araneus ventricosus TaxID=182803 RepID=A0A4Y2MSV5_ARAVE|nr:hypothetical protein AVEN_51642-1 [Araneus ventricosus]
MVYSTAYKDMMIPLSTMMKFTETENICSVRPVFGDGSKEPHHHYCAIGWRESAYLYGNLSSVNSRCPPPPDGMNCSYQEEIPTCRSMRKKTEKSDQQKSDLQRLNYDHQRLYHESRIRERVH